MKPYILQVGHLGKVSEGQYVAHIAIMDSDAHCFIGIAYKTIVIDAINEEFARKIADIRMEEMMINNASEIDSIYYKNILIETKTKSDYTKIYAGLVDEMDKLRTKQEDLLTAIVKEAQQSAEDGLDIEDMGIKVELDGYEGHLVYAIRTVSEEGSDDYLELKIVSVAYDDPDEYDWEYEWLSIYDFYTGTAEKILSEIMENL
jgi:hypothetical protein